MPPAPVAVGRGIDLKGFDHSIVALAVLTQAAATAMCSDSSSRPPSWPLRVAPTTPASISEAAEETFNICAAAFSPVPGPPEKEFWPPPIAAPWGTVGKPGDPYRAAAKPPY